MNLSSLNHWNRDTYMSAQDRSLNRLDDKAEKIGDLAKQFLDTKVYPVHNRTSSLQETWDFLVPKGLAEHCCLDGVKGGRLKVLVDSPVYMYELRLCVEELTAELQRLCPKAGIKQIYIAIG